jgi:hypothetical protein
LDENVRYQGGAFRSGIVTEIVDAAERANVGIYQMPCPEQRAWGGVARRFTLPLYGAKAAVWYRFRQPLLWLFVMRCRFVYRRLARTVVRDLADLAEAGTEVCAVVGVSVSPTCGICRTLALPRTVDALSRCHLESTNPRTFAREVVEGSAVDGQGLFIRALRGELRRHRLNPALVDHDFLAEMRNEPVFLTLPIEERPEEGAAAGKK